MNSTTISLPSVVVIQERHVKYGETYRVFRVNTRSKREYIAKFLAPKKLFLRNKSKQVSIGRRVKEIKYKGSPLAISRLLFIEGLEDPFPPIEEDTPSVRMREAINNNSASTSSGLSYFNLCDNDVTNISKRKYYDVDSVNTSAIKKQFIECSPDNLPDFDYLFKSFNTEFERSEDSDEEDNDSSTVEVVSNDENDEDKEDQPIEKINESISKIEQDVKKIADTIKFAMDAASQKVQVTFPPRHDQNNPPIFLPSTSNPSTTHTNALNFTNPTNTNSGFLSMMRNGTFATSTPTFRLPEALRASRPECHCLIPSGNVPFFRVPGGCLIVLHATHQNTPLLHGTFCNSNNQLQYQQSQLVIFETCQTVCVLLSSNQLRVEEINRIFHFVNITAAFHNSSNIGHF